MRSERNHEHAIGASRVSGLGICDALRLTLDPEQVPRLAAEVEELIRALQATRIESAAAQVRGDSRDGEADPALEYRLRLLDLVRRQVDAPHQDEPIVVVGPGRMMSELVRSTMRHTVEVLGELATGQGLRQAETQDALSGAAIAAAAWVQTYLEAQAVEDFNFDPDVDPYTFW